MRDSDREKKEIKYAERERKVGEEEKKSEIEIEKEI